MNLDNDPNLSFADCLSFNTLDFVVSRILPIHDYTIIETMEVVSFSLFTFMVP